MNTLTQHALAVCLSVALPTAAAAELHAGDKKGAAAAQTGAALSSNNGADAPRSTTEKRTAGAGHHVRCWQYGRLIFEEAIAAIPPEVAAQGMSFRGPPDAKAPLYLLDTDSGALCLVK